MNIEESSIWDLVKKVINSDVKPVHKYWTLGIHANGNTITPLKLLNIDRIRDFEQNTGPVVMVDVVLPLGEYTYLVYPFQDKLEITLYGNPLQEAGQIDDEDAEPVSERFTAYLVDKGNPMMNNNGPNTPTQEILDLTNTITCTFQLMSKTIEQLRMRSYGNNFRNQTVEEVLRTVMTVESQKVDVDSEFLPKGVDIIEPSNKEKMPHILIKQGIPLVDIPNYIHLTQGGIYSAGLGYFYEKDYWYIYPCYDTNRFQKADHTLTVVNIPSNKLPQVERSYLVKGTSLTVLATGDVRFVDDSTKRQLNFGNGVMFADASKIDDGIGKVAGNKLLASRGAVSNDFIAVKRDNGNNYVPMAKQAITANPFVQFSELAKREGSVFAFVWENAEPDLLYPGMPVKVLYLEEEDVKEIYGVLLKAHEFIEMIGQGSTSNRHTTRCMVSVFCQRITEDTGAST